MNFGFLSNIPWFGVNSNREMVTKVVATSGLIDSKNRESGTTVACTSALLESPRQSASFDVRMWGWPLTSVISWASNAKNNIKMPTIVNRQLKRQAQEPPTHRLMDYGVINSTQRFRPYVSKVPWHTGARAFLSQLFPRYGHYCGPNWSSGKDRGSLLWDKRPIDWLDFCCYCHDIGYDSHNQAELLKADLAFLECLERPHMSTKGNVHVARLYKTMCISGLRTILIPYREQLVKLQSQQVSINFGWLSNLTWKRPNLQKT